jgi:polyphosphate glucokinase
MDLLGIDIGGSGIKGSLVNLETGQFTTDRVRIATPENALPKDVAKVVGQVCTQLNYKGPVGCGFPSVVQNGKVFTAANIDQSWIGVNAESLFNQITGNPVYVANDADVAGLAEVTFGAGRGQKGVVMVITLGTGIGSAIFIDGRLVPNTELGHLVIRGKDAEKRASDAARKKKELSFKDWAERLQEYFSYLEALFWPDLFIVGGGISKEWQSFLPLLDLKAKIVPAQLLNQAGIVGAALYAKTRSQG